MPPDDASRLDRKTVLFWPDYSAGNPYQDLLYEKLRRRHDVVPGDIDAALQMVEQGPSRPGAVVFHLHWLNRLFTGNANEASARISGDRFLAKVQRFVEAGGRLIWTIHNTLLHDSVYPQIEIAASARLTGLAQVLHFHSAASVAEAAAVFPVPAEKVRISRHGNYIGAYPDSIDRASARAALGIDEDADVILFLGIIREYKGIDTLVMAVRKLLAERPGTFLIIAGQLMASSPLARLGLPEAAGGERIRIMPERVGNDDLQKLFRAADVAAYPYKRTLTSGSLLLALSFAVPVVVSRSGMTAEVLQGQDAGRLYDPATGVDGLTDQLRALFEAKDAGRLAGIAANARALAETLDWPDFNHVIDG